MTRLTAKFTPDGDDFLGRPFTVKSLCVSELLGPKEADYTVKTNMEEPPEHQNSEADEESSTHPVLNALDTFRARNPHAEVSVADDKLTIDKPFAYPDAQLAFEVDDEMAVTDLNSIEFRQQFDALFHHDTNLIEFIFRFLNPESPSEMQYLDREFKLVMGGLNFNCSIAEPTERLFRIAKGFRRVPSSGFARAGFQLIAFKDSQQVANLPERSQKFFEGRVARSFFVQCECPIEKVDIESLARHLNFLMHYYDRNTPQIVIRGREADSESDKVSPVRFINESFPKTLVSKHYDDVTLKLLEVAAESEPRLAFLYYYQIFEYAGFHFIDAKAKAGIMQVLRDPAIHDNLSQKIGDLFSALSDAAHSDDSRMLKVVEEVCDPCTLWKEVETRREFYAQPTQFRGGFEVPALISSDLSEEGWVKMWSPKLFNQLTKIRNCLVHARERRENRVILPDPSNDQKIECYLPLIRRMAEQITLTGNEF